MGWKFLLDTSAKGEKKTLVLCIARVFGKPTECASAVPAEMWKCKGCSCSRLTLMKFAVIYKQHSHLPSSLTCSIVTPQNNLLLIFNFSNSKNSHASAGDRSQSIKLRKYIQS